MGLLAVDYSYSRPDPHALYAAGYRIAMRYLGTDSRCITKAELARLHDAGLTVGIIGQSSVTRPRGGYPAGVYDAQRYNHLADDLGAPDWLPIFYVVDVGGGFPAPGDNGAIRDYAAGILATPGRPVGFYGPYPILELLRDLEVNLRRIVCWWQTAGASGSGQGTGGSIRTGDGSVRRLSSLACMFQHYGLTGTFGNQIDHNTVHMEPVTWAWHPSGTAPTKPQPEEDDMINWRPVHCPEAAPAGTGNAQWMTTFDGDGRGRRLFLGPGDVEFWWGLGYLQGTEAIVKTGADAEKYLALPEALPSHLDELRQAIEAELRQEHGDDIDEAALARYVAAELAARLAS